MLEDITFRALHGAANKHEQVLIDSNINNNLGQDGIFEILYNTICLDESKRDAFKAHTNIMKRVLEFCQLPNVKCIPEVYREIIRYETILSRTKQRFENAPFRVKSKETLLYFKEYVDLVRQWVGVLKEKKLIMAGEVYSAFAELEKHLQVLCRKKKTSGRHKPAEVADHYLVASAFCSQPSTCVVTNDSDVIRLLRGTYHIVKAIEHNENENYFTNTITICGQTRRNRYEEIMNTSRPQTMGNAAYLAEKLGGIHHFKRLVFSAYSILKDALQLPKMIKVPKLKEFVYSERT